MKRSIFVVALLLFLVEAGITQYLEVRRSATVKEKPKRDSKVIARPEKGDYLSLLDQGAQKNGYYKVEVGIQQGWIYRTLVRRFEGEIPADAVPFAEAAESRSEDWFWPAFGPNEEVIDHESIALSYNEDFEQANWVAYYLTPDRVTGNVNRTENFRPDDAVTTGSAELSDYSGSGFDRGHLAPAADMAWSRHSMSTSFLLSNMSPQSAGFNRGVWKRLESLVRDWAAINPRLYVVTGPVFAGNMETVGSNEVAVPPRYYKVVLAYTGSAGKAVGILIDHEKSPAPLSSFLVTIDDVEEETGIDFFPNLPDSIEERIEGQFSPEDWPLE